MNFVRFRSFLSLLFILGCSPGININLSSSSEFGGRIRPLNSTENSLSVFSLSNSIDCVGDIYAHLFKLNTDGTLESNPIASVPVKNGNYSFPKKLVKKSFSSDVRFQVEISGCNSSLSRPVTDLNLAQDVSFESSLIGAITKVRLNKNLYHVNVVDVNRLIISISGESVFEAYENLTSTPQLSAKFVQIFADTPLKLLESYPSIEVNSFPVVLSEGLPSYYKVRAFHFDPSYQTAFEWHMEGIERSITSQWQFAPTGNSSGNYNIILFIGKNDGTGHVDRSKPFYVSTKPITVLDTVTVTTPLFSMEKEITNSNTVLAHIETGVRFEACDSFSKFLITESSIPPDSTSLGFSRSCTTEVDQTETYVITGAEGLKTLSLWSLDSQGKVSHTSSSKTLLLDKTNPVISISGVSGAYAGGKTIPFMYSSSDVLSGLEHTEILISYNSSPFVKLKDISNAGTSETVTAPLIDASDVRLQLRAVDLAGNEELIQTSVFTIDSTAPLAPSLTLTSAAKTNSKVITFMVSCNGASKILIGENVVPTDTIGWQACTSPLSSILGSSANGTRTLKAYGKDDVGNVSSLSSLTIVYDSNLPLASIDSTPSLMSSESTFNFHFSGSDNISLDANLIIMCSLNGSAYSGCTSPSSRTGFINGSNTFSVKVTDEAGNVSLPVTYTWSFDTSQPTVSFINVTSLSPSPSNVTTSRTITLGGTNVVAYKYKVINSGACSGVNYTSLSEITLAGNTSLSFAPSADGKYQVCAIGKSSFGVWQTAANASASPLLTIDTVVPSLSSLTLSPGSFGTSTSPSVSGVTKNGSSVSIHSGCANPAIATVLADDSSGSFTVTSSTLTLDGIYSFYVKAKDDAGNEICSSALIYTLDRQPPTLTLTNFDGGDFVKGGQLTNITWSLSDTNLTASPVSLEYSLNAGASWSSIASNLGNIGTYSWNMPGFNSSVAKIRIKALDKASNISTYVSASTFTIDSSAPIISLTSLNGSQYIKGGTTQTINWLATDTNFSGNWITLSYSSDAGTTWNNLGSSTNTGSFNWNVPAVDSSAYRIMVSAQDRVGQIAVSSSATSFTIDSTPPVVNLTSFTGGQAVLGNSYQSISWSAADLNFGPTPISIDLSSDSGSTWTSIANNLPNSGSFSWKVSVIDATNYRVRVKASDLAGYVSSSSSVSDFRVSTQAPKLTQTAYPSPYFSNSDTSLSFSGTCDVGYSVFVTGEESATLACTTGTWNWTTQNQASDATRNYNFTQTNAVLSLTISAVWVRDTVAPTLTSLEINDNELQTGIPLASVKVATTESKIYTRLANADTVFSSCQTKYANNNWQSQTSTETSFSHVLSAGDGQKKVCAWVKDYAGNVTTISPPEGTLQIDMDTITLASGNPPTISFLSVANDGGGDFQGSLFANLNDPIKVGYTINDVEGLDNNPISLSYTLNGTTWIPIENAYGNFNSNPTSASGEYFGFSAPSANFFRLKMRIKDMAGNTSVEILSKPFNTSPWSIFAGNSSRGLEGSGRSATITRHALSRLNFAMNPTNGDVYYQDHGTGTFKVSGATGIVSSFLVHGNNNIPSSGVLNSSMRSLANSDSLFFDKSWISLSSKRSYSS